MYYYIMHTFYHLIYIAYETTYIEGIVRYTFLSLAISKLVVPTAEPTYYLLLRVMRAGSR